MFMVELLLVVTIWWPRFSCCSIGNKSALSGNKMQHMRKIG